MCRSLLSVQSALEKKDLKIRELWNTLKQQCHELLSVDGGDQTLFAKIVRNQALLVSIYFVHGVHSNALWSISTLCCL